MLQQLLGLRDVDCAILNFSGQMLLSRHAHSLAGLIPTLSYDDAIHSLATILGIDVQATAISLKSSSLLVEYRLIEVRRDPTNLENVLKIPANVQVCLTEHHDNL